MSTLIRPPPVDPELSRMENVLDLTQLPDIDADLFTNTRPLFLPPGARGIFGGAVIAQCLSAAQRTVTRDFTVHSMHCYFVLPGNATIPILYHVERVRDGKSFVTRTVQARQRGKVIFTTTLSFVKENTGGKKQVKHAAKMPDIPPPSEENEYSNPGWGDGPFTSQRVEIYEPNNTTDPTIKRARQWVKAKGKISPKGGHEAHLSALAYMSDSYFIGTIARVHKLWRWSPKRKDNSQSTVDEDQLKKLLAMDDEALKKIPGMDDEIIKRLRSGEDPTKEDRPTIGMMVSLDHTIYFHNPREFRADEWLFTEMDTPWAGDGRGVVFQKIYTRDGTLVATCIQEGVVRLKQDSASKL